MVIFFLFFVYLCSVIYKANTTIGIVTNITFLLTEK